MTVWRVKLSDQGESLFMGTIRDITESTNAHAELESLNQQLIDSARQAGKAEVATSVLHNVGNVLNSVNVSAEMIQNKVRKSGVTNLKKAVGVLEQNIDNLGEYVTRDERGKHLPRFLIDLSREMESEESVVLQEVTSLIGNIEHIKTVIATQQSYSKGIFGGVDEAVSLDSLLNDAIHVNTASMRRHAVEIIREFDDVPPIMIDKHKVLQIAVNLVSNAKYACTESSHKDHRITMRLRRKGEDRVVIEAQDNGIGIPNENLTRIFSHGFTTRKEGHGFGLHSAALAAKELRGTLTVHSDGPGAGATFILELPYTKAGVSLCTT
jgi:signal transduction histidine kinase